MSGVSSGYGWRVYGDESLVRVEYVGTADELIAAGLATAETLAPRPKRGKRPKRVDAQGIKCRVESWWVGVGTDNQHRRYKLWRHLPADSLEGCRALAVTEAALRRRQQRLEALRAAGEAMRAIPTAS